MSAPTAASTLSCLTSPVASSQAVCLRRLTSGRMTSASSLSGKDQRTDFGLSGCASLPGGTCGVFTSVSGSAPNRIFNIEWRTVLYADNNATENYEIRLYQNGPLKTFEVIIGALNSAPATENM